MDLDGQSDMRRAAEGSRRAPREPTRIVATFDNGALGKDIERGPIVLTIEATSGDSELAPWLDDIWWTGVIQRWAECHVTVCIAPTPGALLHPVVLHQVEMLRRVVPDWRIVGHAYVDDVPSDDDATRLAGSPYHEVRFIDQPRLGTPPSDRCTWKLTVDGLFVRICNEQSRLGVSLPVLVRLPATPPETASASPASARRAATTATSPDTLSQHVAQNVRGTARPIRQPDAST